VERTENASIKSLRSGRANSFTAQDQSRAIAPSTQSSGGAGVRQELVEKAEEEAQGIL
jgi:hypothetical protein